VQGPIEQETIQKRLIDETVEKFGRLDILVSVFEMNLLANCEHLQVNNAGTPRHPDLATDSLENLDFVMSTNLRRLVFVVNKCRLPKCFEVNFYSNLPDFSE
jgi:NAD(P)-dependent dehydrogenase (short-subunit alcohol dehydrogenase family)